jgi:hypothetical protein
LVLRSSNDAWNLTVSEEADIAIVTARRRPRFLAQKLQRAFNPGSRVGGTVYQDVTDGLAQEELKGLSCMLWGRLAALAVLAVWAVTLPFERSAGYFSAIADFQFWPAKKAMKSVS